MTLILIAIHIIVCFTLILIVLLQTGKGADMGAAFGAGSSQTVFGSTGASTFLSKSTTIAAIIFMVTSLALAWISGHRTGSSIMMEQPVAPIESPVPTDTVPADVPAPVEGEIDMEEPLPAETPQSEAIPQDGPVQPSAEAE